MKLFTTFLAIFTAAAFAVPEQGIKCGGKNEPKCFDKPNENVKIGEHCGGLHGSRNREYRLTAVAEAWLTWREGGCP